MLELTARQELISVARSMNTSGLNQGTSGNLSVRYNDSILITPSALSYDSCQPGDIVKMSMDGTAMDRHKGRQRPSSEWRLHLDIFQTHPEAGAVLHAHPPWCTTLACLDRKIPAFHYMVAMAGGNSIPCAGYAVYGSRALSDQVNMALAERSACLMSHHGMVCFGDTPQKTLELAIEVENLARVYSQALQIGEPSLLDQEQIDEVTVKFADYKTIKS